MKIYVHFTFKFVGENFILKIENSEKCSFCNKKQTFFALNEEKYKIWENRK